MTITRNKLSTAVQTAMEISKGESDQLIVSVFEIIKKTLEAGEEILIYGFGRFYVLDKRARRGRNPQTGEDLTIAERRVVTFRATGALRDRINGASIGGER